MLRIRRMTTFSAIRLTITTHKVVNMTMTEQVTTGVR